MDDEPLQGSNEQNSGNEGLVQPRQNRPSDDNQRHSNKVESIEVVINSFDRAHKSRIIRPGNENPRDCNRDEFCGDEYVPQMGPDHVPMEAI